MKKVIFVLFVVSLFGFLFITCQDATNPNSISEQEGPLNVESCTPPPPETPPCDECCGRMTGGGSVFFRDDDGTRVRVTRGFEIHCDRSLPNNLQVNWRGGNRFHLTELTEAICTDDENIIQDPPAAPFDTFIGRGKGRLNKVDGANIWFEFVDAGEPGKFDSAWIIIWTDDFNNPVLEVSGLIEVGNLQAHDDKCP